MLAALSCEDVDYAPCSFMLFHSLYQRCSSEREFVERQVEMGLDAFVHVGQLNPELHLKGTPHPDVRFHEWVEGTGENRVFCRRIETPEGDLTGRVRRQNAWPTEGELPLFNDWIVPRAEKTLVDPERDLAKAKYLFDTIRDRDIKTLRESAREAAELARKYGLLQVGGWKGAVRPGTLVEPGVMGVDAMAWLSGYEEVMVLSISKPHLIREYANIIHEWNIRQIEIYLDVTEAELIIRRGWYETSEFWTPLAYRTIIAPLLKREVDLVHQADRKFGYIITSAFMPMCDDILDTGIDVLIGLDPVQGKGTSLETVKERFADRKRALWGGVSGALTVELGSEEETELAVRGALEVLGPKGFILSPVDNVSEDTEVARRNTAGLIETWKKHR